MNRSQMPDYASVRTEKQRLGLLFGIIAGLSFAAVAWGYDAYIRTIASVNLPWLLFAFGATFCLLVGAFAGWLSVRLDSSLISLIAWLLAGISFAWLASHLPFEGKTYAAWVLDPPLRGLNLYPFAENIQRRMVIVYFVVGLSAGLAGILENLLVDAARAAARPVTGFLALCVCIPLMAIAGTAADNINAQFRAPLVAVNDLIQLGLKSEVAPIDPIVARDMHLKALSPIQDWLHRPRQLIVGSYDSTYLDSFKIYINFGQAWAECGVLVNNPLNCQPSLQIYGKKVACLLDGGDAESCSTETSQPAQTFLKDWRQQGKTAESMGIITQAGNATLLALQDTESHLYRCLMRSSATSISLDNCTGLPQQSLPATTLEPAITPDPTLTPTPAPAGQAQPTATQAVEESSISPLQATLPYTLPQLSNASRYTITLDLDYSQHAFQGEEQVQYTNTETTSLDKVYFRLLPNGHESYGNGSLTVSRTQVNGQTAETQLTLENTVLEIPLATPLAPGQRLRFDLDFSGQVPIDFGGSQTPSGYGIYNISEDVMALSGWYPILAVYDQQGWNLDPVSPIGDSVYSDVSFYSVDLSASSDLVLASTGVVEGSETAGQVTHYHLLSGPARDFFLVLSPHFQIDSQTVGGATLNSYYLPGNEAGGKQALVDAAAALRVYDQKFGPYPYTSLAIVDAPMRNASGVEYPEIVLIGDNLYGDPQNPAFNVTVSHEVAHQWWYGVVGNDVFDEPWLDEALATYSSLLPLEAENGPGGAQGLIQYWQKNYTQLKQDSLDDQITQSLGYFESLRNPRVYAVVVYSKGALFFNALRDEIGDKAFFQALRNYYQANDFQIATGNELLAAFEEAAGRPLDAFYQKWLSPPTS